MKSHVGNSVLLFFVLGSPLLPEVTRVDDLRQVYRKFNDIYQHHVQVAEFHTLKGAEFKSLKECLIFVSYLLKKNPDLPSDKRTKFIRAFLIEDNLRRTRHLHPENDINNEPGKSPPLSMFSRIVGLFSGSTGTDEESLRKELKKITSGVTDSDFLVQLKGIADKDLEAPIRRVVDLACTQLSILIDTAVNKMTHAVLRMQQEECKRSVQRRVEAEEKGALRSVLSKFIGDVNKISARRENS
jgi:hypothetical protein